MRVLRRLSHVEHRRDTRVGVTEVCGPLVTGAGADRVADRLAQLGPAGVVVLVGQLGVGQTQTLDQHGVELRLERADGEPATVRALVHVVERRTGVEQVGAALGVPETRGPGAEQRRHEQCGTVDHGGVDDLTTAGGRTFDERGEHAGGQQHAAAAEVGDEVQRRGRRLAGASDVGQPTRQGQVGQVVTGSGRHRTLLPPARHAAVDQPVVPGRQLVGSEPEPLGDAGAEPLDEHVGHVGEVAHRLDTGLGAQVDGDAAAVAVEHVVRVGARLTHDRLGPVDAQYVGPHVGEHHRGERRRTDSCELDHLHPVQGSPHVDSSCSSGTTPARRAGP